MSDSKKPQVGTIGWRDLTVDDAEGVRKFYEGVVGWESSPVDMGGYSDFSLIPPGAGSASSRIPPAQSAPSTSRRPEALRRPEPPPARDHPPS